MSCFNSNILQAAIAHRRVGCEVSDNKCSQQIDLLGDLIVSGRLASDAVLE